MAARTAADGVGAREWLEMDGEEKPLGMSELGMRGRLRTAWVQGSAWKWLGRGVEAAGDERAWLRGRLRSGGNGCVGAREWLEMGGEKKSLGMTASLAARAAADGCGRRGCKGV